MSGKKMFHKSTTVYIILYDDTVGIRKVNQTFFLDFSVYDFAVLLREKIFRVNKS